MTKFLNRALILVLLIFSTTPLRADSIPEIVAKAKPAVVEIVAADATGTPKALGTGFFISPDGLVVTNRHVIEGANSITAVNNNGAMFLFERVVAQPVGVDLAVLKFRATDVPFLTLGKSTTAVEGQKVIVIGNPTGLTATVSDGIISAFREDRSLIQITAPISRGSSGSPVMDETGQVIGVATLLSMEGQNLNFAIAVEKVSAALAKPPSGRIVGSALPTPTPQPGTNAKIFFDSGKAFSDKHEYDRAISDFTEAIRLDPSYARAYCNRGIAYLNSFDLEKAIGDFTEAIRLDPNSDITYAKRGDAYISQSHFDEAISDYSQAIRLEPDFAYYYERRGDAHRYHGDFEKAITDYTDAIRLSPYTVSALSGRGDTYHKLGKLDLAIKDYTESIRLYPKNVFAYVSRGSVYDEHGDFEEAIKDFDEAIRLQPNYALAYENRGLAYLRVGERDKADADFATAKRLQSGQ